MPDNITDSLPVINHSEYHLACALAVDDSGSMGGDPIAEANQGLREFGVALQEDELARGRVDLTVISFNSSVKTELGFRPATEYEAPTLQASGFTAMNEAINVALDALEARKGEYRDNGIPYYRPWLFVLTDGEPTDTHLEASTRKRLQDAIRNKKVVYLPMGIGEKADIEKLRSYYPEEAEQKPVLKANANNFKEAFAWLSASIAAVTNSSPDLVVESTTPPVPRSLTVEL